MTTITAKYEWYGETKTIQLTPHNYGHRFQYDGITYQVERDAKRNSKWNVYRVTWNEHGTRRIHHPLVLLAVSRKQAIADALFQAMTEALEDETPEPSTVTLPALERRDVPDSSHRDYGTHHDAVYADPRLTSLDIAARYHGEHSHDNGATWTLLRVPHFYDTVCGGHVQCEVAGALQFGWDVIADGTTRIVRHGESHVSRWTLTVLTDEETAAMEEMLRESRARAR